MGLLCVLAPEGRWTAHAWHVPTTRCCGGFEGALRARLTGVGPSSAPPGREGRVVTIPRVPFAFGELHPWLQPPAPSGPNTGSVGDSRVHKSFLTTLIPQASVLRIRAAREEIDRLQCRDRRAECVFWIADSVRPFESSWFVIDFSIPPSRGLSAHADIRGGRPSHPSPIHAGSRQVGIPFRPRLVVRHPNSVRSLKAAAQ